MLELGAWAGAVMAVILLLAMVFKGLLLMIQAAQRLEDVCDNASQVPELVEHIAAARRDVAVLTGQVTALSGEVRAAASDQAQWQGIHGGLLSAVQRDVDNLAGMHRELAGRVDVLELRVAA
jgi:hypothetical protein